MTSTTAPSFNIKNVTAETLTDALTRLIAAIEAHAGEYGWCSERFAYMRGLTVALVSDPNQRYPEDYAPVPDVSGLIPAVLVNAEQFFTTDEGRAYFAQHVTSAYAAEVELIYSRLRWHVKQNRRITFERANTVLGEAGWPLLIGSHSYEVYGSSWRAISTTPEHRESWEIATAFRTALAEVMPGVLASAGLAASDPSSDVDLLSSVEASLTVVDGPTVRPLTR